MRQFFDGLVNAVSGLGTAARDKAVASEYVLREPTWQELTTAYRTSWLAKKIVDIPADDSVREWRNWQGDGPDIEAVEAEESRLDLVPKVREARKMARLYGGALIYMATGEEDLSEPLNPERIGLGGLQYLTVLPPSAVTTGVAIDDPRDPWYGHPSDYRLTIATGGNLSIHPSRMARFDGARRLDKTAINGTTGGWHDSVLMAVLEEIKRTDGVVANVASLVFEAKVDVIQIAGLMDLVDDPLFEEKVMKRLRAASLGKSNHGTLVMDKDTEAYEQKTMSFAQLPEMIEKFQTTVSGAADIPTTRLFGRSPDGMNSTGESDTRNYYDMVKAQQSLDIGPSLRLLDECLIRSALGQRPDELHYIWAPLWQPSTKEVAEAGEIVARTIGHLATAQLFPEAVLAQTAVTAMTEYGALPGLESADGEFGGDLDEADEPDLIEVPE